MRQVSMMGSASKRLRSTLAGAALAALGWASALAPSSASAQADYPNRLVKVVVPFPSGSSPDAIARLWGERVAKATGQPIIIENRPGAATIIGAQAVAASPADGYTLLYTVNNTTSINPYIYKTLPYKPEAFVPVIRILSVPYVLIVPASSPFKTLGELVAFAKANPGKLNYASYGPGQGTHVAMAWFANAVGVSMTHVPYKDGGLTDLMAGTINLSFEPTTTAIPLIQSGRVRGLAVSGPKRVDVLKDVPAVAESVPGFLGDSWHGILAPQGTPPDVTARLVDVSQKVIQSADFQARLHELGLIPAGGSSDDFARFLANDAKAWSKVVKDNDIKAE